LIYKPEKIPTTTNKQKQQLQHTFTRIPGNADNECSATLVTKRRIRIKEKSVWNENRRGKG
jgi:hypothetical protein